MGSKLRGERLKERLKTVEKITLVEKSEFQSYEAM